jgi:hypothetical protein
LILTPALPYLFVAVGFSMAFSSDAIQCTDTSDPIQNNISCVLNFLTPVRFMLDGENINEESTPADMDLEDNDQIDCFLAPVGGGERLF